jgi:hypothetical protein
VLLPLALVLSVLVTLTPGAEESRDERARVGSEQQDHSAAAGRRRWEVAMSADSTTPGRGPGVGLRWGDEAGARVSRASDRP